MTPVRKRKADFVGDESRTGDLSLAAAPVPKPVESVEHIAPRGTEVHKIRGSEVQIFRGVKVAIYMMGGSSMYVQKSISRVCSRMQV